jgi:hypothetical protein
MIDQAVAMGVLAMGIKDTLIPVPGLDAALEELRRQGLTVRLHSGQNNTWHVADGGLFSGYVASGDELLELKRADNLNLSGIKSLG